MQFNRTANKGNRSNDTEKGKTQNKPAEQSLQNRTALSDRTAAEPFRAASEFPPPSSPPLELSMMAHGMEYPALFGQVRSACPAVPLPGFPSWIPVKINPVLAEPRTDRKRNPKYISVSCLFQPFPNCF